MSDERLWLRTDAAGWIRLSRVERFAIADDGATDNIGRVVVAPSEFLVVAVMMVKPYEDVVISRHTDWPSAVLSLEQLIRASGEWYA